MGRTFKGGIFKIILNKNVGFQQRESRLSVDSAERTFQVEGTFYLIYANLR